MLDSIIFTLKEVKVQGNNQKYIIIGYSTDLYYIKWNEDTVLPENVVQVLMDNRLVAGFKQDNALYVQFMQQFNKQLKDLRIQQFLTPPFDYQKFTADNNFQHYQAIYDDGNVFKDKECIQIDGRHVCEEAYAMTQVLVKKLQDKMKQEDIASMQRKYQQKQQQQQKYAQNTSKISQNPENQSKVFDQIQTKQPKTAYKLSDKKEESEALKQQEKQPKTEKTPKKPNQVYKVVISKQENDKAAIDAVMSSIPDLNISVTRDSLVIKISRDNMRKYFNLITTELKGVKFEQEQ